MNTASGVMDLSSDRRRTQQESQCRVGNGVETQHIFEKRKEFELKIQSYCGSDPLELRYKFINWIESNYSNRGLDSGYITVLQETLSLLRDDPRYQQDNRYIALLIKYIELQPNALEVYKCVYDQGRGTACAILYHAWANYCEKVNDFKLANEIYQLGLSNKAEPFEELKEVHLQFQLNVGRRMLGINDSAPNTPCREALKKLQINNQPSQIRGLKEDKNEISNGKAQKIHSLVSEKENSSPAVKKLHEAEKVPFASGVAQFKGRIRTDKPDTFQCPVAHFEAYEPTKLVMYPKDKIYAVNNREFQLEELIAMLYENEQRPRKFAKPAPPSSKEDQGAFGDNLVSGNGDGAWSLHRGLDDENFTCPIAYFEPEDPNKIPMYPKAKVYSVEGKEFQLEELKAMEYELKQNKSVQNASISTLENSVKTPNQGTPHFQASCEKVLQDSMLNNQSLTVATKEAMNVVGVMWNSPLPVSVKNCNAKASCEKLDSETFKCPLPRKSGFALYTDESFSGQLSSTSKQPEFLLKPAKPFIPCDAENIPCAPNSILRSKLREKGANITPSIYQDREFGNVENELGVHRLNSGEEINALHFTRPTSEKKLPLSIYSDETDTVKCCVRKETGEFKTVTPCKIDYVSISCSNATTSTCKPTFVIACDNSIINQEVASSSRRNQLVPAEEYNDENQYPCLANVGKTRKDDPVVLPHIPVPLNDIPVLGDEGKENADPENYYLKRPERRELSGILQPSLNIQTAPHQLHNHDKEYDLANDTCNTKAFAFALPSSTPFTNQFKNFIQNCANNDNTVTYCSYMAPEEAAKQNMPTELSVILEASKERYSSSSGSSSSGQTPYGPSRMKTVNTYSEIKGSELYHISEESVNNIEKSLGRLQLEEEVDPFCPELLKKLLSHINFPQKLHSFGYVVINQEAPVLRENSNVTLGKEKYSIEKELGRGSYARVLKATHKNKTVALKYQKPAFEWEYYIACELRKRLASSQMKNHFMEVNQVYIFNNASILETEWLPYGSLINVVNAVKLKTAKPLNKTVATLFCVQLFSIVEHLHQCQIIHGDIKPDNFILQALPTKSDSSQLCIKLIDFGRSIDMTLLPEGTTFTTIVSTDGFQCNEMKENRPWTYQTDYYGLAGTAYCLLMGEYMKVIKRGGKWGLQQMLPRYLHRDVWQPIFQDLLNIESCTSLPNLSVMRTKLEELSNSMGRVVFDHLNSVANIIQGH